MIEFRISAYATQWLRAELLEENTFTWIRLHLKDESRPEMDIASLFFDDRALAKLYAEAINGVNVKPPVEEAA